MYKVLNTSALPDGCGVAIEFSVPYTSIGGSDLCVI